MYKVDYKDQIQRQVELNKDLQKWASEDLYVAVPDEYSIEEHKGLDFSKLDTRGTLNEVIQAC